MRRLSFILSLCLLLPLTAVPAFAAPTAPASPPDTTAASAKESGGKTEIVTDEKAHTVRVMIDGKTVVTIDAAGLHINGDIAYSGILTDTGGKSR